MKRNLCKILNLCLIFSLMVHIFMPLTILADGDTVTFTITFKSEQSRATLAKNHDNNSGLDILNAVIDGHDNFLAIESTSNSNDNLRSVSITCTDNGTDPITTCAAEVTVTKETSVRVVIGGDTPIEPSENVDNISSNMTVNFRDRQLAQPFNGNAYLIWDCSGKVCMHYFHDDDKLNPINYIDANTITDTVNGNNTKFDVHSSRIAFSDDAKMGNWMAAYRAHKGLAENAVIDFKTVDINDLIGDPVDMRKYEEDAVKAGVCSTEGVDEDTFHACVDMYVVSTGDFTTRAQLQPVGEPDFNNTYVSYGDRQFKAIIYNSDARGLQIGSLESLSYYPAKWSDPLVRTDVFDISGTTEDNPTTIDTILLESNLELTVADMNGFVISKFEPIGVPEGAVDVQVVDGVKVRLNFHSNFYDKVVFKVTDTNKKTYYVKIKRMAIDAWMSRNQDGMKVQTEIFYDNRTSYTDYSIKATIIYKDGSTKVVDMINSKRIDDGLGNPVLDYEVDEEHPPRDDWAKGKGIKRADYHYDISEAEARKIDTVYVSVEKSGSTSTKFAGSFAGSGKGEVLKMSDWLRD